MPTTRWHARLPGIGYSQALRDWLTEPESLTARCQRACRKFRIRLVSHGRGKALAEDVSMYTHSRVREVVLECDGVPVIFAHTTTAADARGRMTRWMRRLGSRSLGSLLFAYPGFRRGGIEFLRLDARHPLHSRAIAHTDNAGPLWARRSRHYLDGQAVLVTEVFLPAIERLK